MKPLFKCTSIDGMSPENLSNFPNASSVITLIWNTGANFKIWDHLAGAKDTFLNLRMVQRESPVIKKIVTALCREGLSFSPSLVVEGLETNLPDERRRYCHGRVNYV